MGRKLIRCALLLLMLVLIISLEACSREPGPVLQWSYVYEYGSAYSAQQTNDGNYVVCGNNIWGDCWLLKTDLDGNELWRQIIDTDSKNNHGRSCQKTADGGYIVCGLTNYLHEGDSDVWLVKTDADGNKLWDKTFGGEKDDGGYSVQQTTDGGYIICGTTESYGVSNKRCWEINGDIWLIKTDADGNKLWDVTFGGDKSDEGDSVQQTTDGGYIVCGKTPRNGGYPDIRIIKTDGDGNQLWGKTFQSISLLAPCSPVQQTTDGGYVMCGHIYYGSIIIKTDAAGNELWRKTFYIKEEDERSSVKPNKDGGSLLSEIWEVVFQGVEYMEARSVEQTRDGGYIICGSEFHDSVWTGLSEKIFLLRTDIDGNRLWYETFGGKGRNEGVSVQQTADGGYILCGNKGTGGGFLVFNAWLLKIAPEQ